ncbi:M23 family metallopeptidase [Treponema socranskii]|uniref:M23 family metallopeptidase n=1 Tax=Treponema socranskii TaxID=53419 RepID=UPI0028F13785|nr:M23 family metallopeptidase [Treponema socranskii]
MEIINYVGFEGSRTKPSVKLPFFFGERKNNISYALTHSPLTHSFAAAAVRPNFSLRSFLISLGRFSESALSHWKAGVAVIAVFAFLSGAKARLSYAASHTGPLALKDSGKAELETLDKVMAAFVADASVSYTDSGDIVGSGKSRAELAALFKKPVSYQTYTVRSGDTLGGITKRFGLTNLSTLIDVNGITNARSLHEGQKLRIPSVDGLMYTVSKGNSLTGLSAKFNVPLEDLLDVNDLASQTLTVGQQLFIPGAKMDAAKLHEVLGDLFKIPITAAYRISSKFGWRPDPFTGVRSYHTGIDLACPEGTPIRAAMNGTIAFVGWSNVFGNYIIVNHPNGYQTLYGHLSASRVKKGQSVTQATVIGLVGSTGYSTGAHLHFTVYKNGRLVNPSSVLK